MLRISKIVDYGTVVMTYLVSQPYISHNARIIAKETRLPLPMVSKILKLLAKSGLLLSERGVQGGYRLAKPASEISVAQIVTSLDNPISLTECSHSSGGNCSFEEHCGMKTHWSVISKTISDTLERISLADMVSTPAAVKSEAIKINVQRK